MFDYNNSKKIHLKRVAIWDMYIVLVTTIYILWRIRVFLQKIS